MEDPPALAYRRCALERSRLLFPDAETVDEPELFGHLPTVAAPAIRLTVLADDALPVLAAALLRARDGLVAVAASAPACASHLRASDGWHGSDATAMGLPDLHAVPEVPWPAGLRIVPVRRTPEDDPAGVPLDDAVALLDADGPGRPGARESLGRHLAGLRATTLLAAVDDAGTVRATAGTGVFGTSAHVIFVNTHPAWRRRGVGTAMTAAALARAATAGATTASLDASSSGRGPYERLGFVAVADVARFTRHAR